MMARCESIELNRFVLLLIDFLLDSDIFVWSLFQKYWKWADFHQKVRCASFQTISLCWRGISLIELHTKEWKCSVSSIKYHIFVLLIGKNSALQDVRTRLVFARDQAHVAGKISEERNWRKLIILAQSHYCKIMNPSREADYRWKMNSSVNRKRIIHDQTQILAAFILHSSDPGNRKSQIHLHKAGHHWPR